MTSKADDGKLDVNDCWFGILAFTQACAAGGLGSAESAKSSPIRILA